MLRDGSWRANAAHANAQARRFAAALAGLPDLRLAFPVEANAVFIQAPPEKLAALRAQGWHFYDFIGNSARFMFSWNSDQADVDRLIASFHATFTNNI
jgi:threonine aldolase